MGLTKEEKKALKLAKKLEKAKLEAELKKRRKLEELEREMAAHDLQQIELKNRLKKLMVRAKEPVYKQTIEAMGSTFSRAVDKKDHLISLTMRLRRVAENQYQRTIASFCEIVDSIIGTFLIDLENMCKETDKKTLALLKQGRDETKYIIEYQKRGETHLNILLYHSHELADNLAWTIRGENFVKKDEDTSKYLEVRDHLRGILEGLYTHMWEQFKGTLKSYTVSTAENQKQVRLLRKKETIMNDIIASQAKKIAASEGIIRRLRNELIAYESGTKQAGFRDRRNRHKDACLRLKQYLTKSVEIDEKQLDRLVMVSNISASYIEAACKKSETILRLAALCRKLETEYEKVLPFGTVEMNDTAQVVESKKSCCGRRKTSEDSLVANAISTTCGLTRLWQRISKVELSKRALCREKMLLEQDNANMMLILEMRGQEKPSAQSTKYECLSKPSKRSINQSHAVEGSLEAKKIYATTKLALISMI